MALLLHQLCAVLVVEGLAQLLLAGAGVAPAVGGGADGQIQVGEWLHLCPRPQAVSEHDHILLTVEDVEVGLRAATGEDVVVFSQLIARLTGG